jgi:tetratricopeptide (TPR) repeat protein
VRPLPGEGGKPNASLFQARAKARLALHQTERVEAVRQKSFDDALRVYDRAVELAEPVQKANLHAERLGRLSAQSQRLALGDFQTAVALQSNHASALAGWGYVLVQRGDYLAGAARANQAAQSAGANPSWRLFLNAARIYAQAVGKIGPTRKGARPRAGLPRPGHPVPRTMPGRRAPEERSRIWEQHIRSHSDCRPLWTSDDFWKLDRQYGRAFR